ncbi:MAG: hypothetical protein K2H29_00205, partial [Oscillospiraceae bacterium]|nr:hypothetical protein [Oscillospiraceae bacterium]
YKYYDEIQNNVIDYVDQYFEDYKLVTKDKTERITEDLPFDTPAYLSYEELKEGGFLSPSFHILIPENTIFSEEEWSILTEKIASSNEYTDDNYIRSAYKKDINFGVYFMVFRVPDDVYQDLEFITTFDEFRKLKNNQNYEITRIL